MSRSEYRESVATPGSRTPPFRTALEVVGPGFFQLLQMHLLEGRDFGWRDDETAERVAIISENLARRLFPGESPIGRKIDFSARKDRKGLQIVGVVNTASLWMPQSREPMAVYIPLMQEPGYDDLRLEVRTIIDPLAIAGLARKTITSMGRHSVLRMQTLDQRLDGLLTNERLLAMLASFLGGTALLLAAIGLYGLMSLTVTQRIPEMGLRMALGGQPGDVVAMVLREAIWLVLGGMAVGVLTALTASRLVSGMIFEVAPNDPVTIAMASAILFVVAVFAAFWPAKRASRVDPATALRGE